MRHTKKILADQHPYEIVLVTLEGETSDEQIQVRSMNTTVENYLIHDVGVVEFIEGEAPTFKVKILKKNLGIGNVR